MISDPFLNFANRYVSVCVFVCVCVYECACTCRYLSEPVPHLPSDNSSRVLDKVESQFRMWNPLWAWHPGKATSTLSTVTTRDIKMNVVFKTPAQSHVPIAVSTIKDCQFLKYPNYKQAIDLDEFDYIIPMNCCLHWDHFYCGVYIWPDPS